MKPSELRKVVFDLAGNQCEWPKCATPTYRLVLAHITHRGMGGAPSRNLVENSACLCEFHHDILDGRVMQGRRFEVGALLRAYLRGVT